MMQTRQFQIIAGRKKKRSDVSQDATAITFQDLLHNPTLNLDVLLQNRLQKELSHDEVAMKLPVTEKGSKQEYQNRLVVNEPVPLPSCTDVGQSNSNALDFTTSPPLCVTPLMAK
eukprot:14612983-Ditylum_brightwellii.AAC.1